jgi:NADPH:quinone reductase-like Zn-dependent oxidoreductase
MAVLPASAASELDPMQVGFPTSPTRQPSRSHPVHARHRSAIRPVGVGCILEIGGPGTIAKSLKALAVGGHVSLIGASQRGRCSIPYC